VHKQFEMSAFTGYAPMDASHRARGGQESEGDDGERGSHASDRGETDVAASGGVGGEERRGLIGAAVQGRGIRPVELSRNLRISVAAVAQCLRPLERSRQVRFLGTSPSPLPRWRSKEASQFATTITIEIWAAKSYEPL